MSILVISRSPHMKGTSALLMEESIRGVQEKEHRIHALHATREGVYPCVTCNICHKTGNGCVFKDGMEELNPMSAGAELVVFVTPLYYFGMSVQIKAVLDHFYADSTALRGQQKKTIVLTTYGDTEDWAFDALKHYFEDAFRYIRWTCIGSVYTLGVYVKENIEQSGYPREAYEPGRGL